MRNALALGFALLFAGSGASFAHEKQCNAAMGDMGVYIGCDGAKVVESAGCSEDGFCNPVAPPCAVGLSLLTYYCALLPAIPAPTAVDGHNQRIVEGAGEAQASLNAAGDGAVTAAAAAAAKAKAVADALALEIEEKNRKLAERLAKQAREADGHQEVLFKNGTEANELGRNQAATVAALWCANGANSQKDNPGVAEDSYGKCQQNFDAAKSFPSAGAGYRADSELMEGRNAKLTMEQFGKKFGLSEDDYMSSLLGSGGGTKKFSELMDGKLPEESLAAGFGAGGDEKFAVSQQGGKPGKKDSQLKDALKKAMADKDAATRAPSSASARKAFGADPIEGLTALKDDLFKSDKADEKELTIFDVVHLKYEEIFRRRRSI